MRQAVLAGLGVGLVPDDVVQDDLKRAAVLTALDAWRLSIFGTHMYMPYMPNRHHARAAAAFIDFVLEQAQGSGRGRKLKRRTQAPSLRTIAVVTIGTPTRSSLRTPSSLPTFPTALSIIACITLAG